MTHHNQGIIDFRIKPPYRDFVTLPIFQADSGFAVPRSTSIVPAELSMAEFFDQMAAAGIAQGVVSGRQAPDFDASHGVRQGGNVGNDVVADLLQEYPERFIGFGAVGNVELADIERTLADFAAWGFKGVTFEPQWFDEPRNFDDPLFEELLTACEETGQIFMVMASIFAGPDITFSDPLHVQRIAARHPRLPIVVSHASWPYINEFLGVALRCPNVYALPDVYGNIPGLADIGLLAQAGNTFLRDRMLFGSCYPVFDMQEAVDGFARWELDAQAREACLSGNARRLLGLETAGTAAVAAAAAQASTGGTRD